MSLPNAADLSLDQVLAFSVKMQASDVHICDGEEIGFRVHGQIEKLSAAGPLSPQHLERFASDLFRGREDLRKELQEKLDMDFSYLAPDGTPFRANGFYKLGRMAFVLRRIARESRTPQDLGMPASVEKVLGCRQGLFLVTGPAGSGKSTSMVSLIDRINEARNAHVVTIEDPVEFIFTPKKSVFSQREVGRDTAGFATALRAALREDPDIVMVGEMRDRETAEAALNLAETGHLVFSTLHTSSSSQTVSRFIQFFPSDRQEQARSRMADALIGTLSQRLVARADANGRRAIYELMYCNHAVRNLVRNGDLVQIDNAIATGTREGMVSMRAFAKKLTAEGVLREEAWASLFAHDAE